MTMRDIRKRIPNNAEIDLRSKAEQSVQQQIEEDAHVAKPNLRSEAEHRDKEFMTLSLHRSSHTIIKSSILVSTM
jgi:hypothetical protein